LTDYIASIKTTGDAHINEQLNNIDTAINETYQMALANAAVVAANDPFRLKEIYLDLSRCLPYWATLGEICPSTARLASLFNHVTSLLELQRTVQNIRDNPFTILGEEWGDVADDLIEIKAEFNRGRTLARNLGTVVKGAELDLRFPSFDAMLASPRMNYATLETQRTDLSSTLQDTLIDTFQASARSSQGQRAEDRAEIERLHAMGRNALGAMQEIEISNMHKINAAGAWAKIVEQQMNFGNLIGLDMSDELYTENRLSAEDHRSMAIDPLNPTVIGDEPSPFLR